MKRDRDGEYGGGTGTGNWAELSEEWARTERHPRLPGEDFSILEVDRGVCIFDSDEPERYIFGVGVEIGEFE